MSQFCRTGAQIMRRTGDLFAVAQEAAIIDPVLKANWRAGHERTRQRHRVFWQRLAEDGLLDPTGDANWLITTALLGGAESFLHVQRLYKWKIPSYERWLVASYRRLARLD